MLRQFIYEHFFLIAKLIIFIGIGLYVYAGFKKKRTPEKISRTEIGESTGISEKSIINEEEKISKNNGLLKGVGVTAITVGSILFIIGIIAIIFVIYILILLKNFFGDLGG